MATLGSVPKLCNKYQDYVQNMTSPFKFLVLNLTLTFISNFETWIGCALQNYLLSFTKSFCPKCKGSFIIQESHLVFLKGMHVHVFKVSLVTSLFQRWSLTPACHSPTNWVKVITWDQKVTRIGIWTTNMIGSKGKGWKFKYYKYPDSNHCNTCEPPYVQTFESTLNCQFHN